jgi:GNAT superfamily N-acetyltransferase
MRANGNTTASWWLTEASTPDDVEELLVARGLTRVDGDYLLDGLLLTTEPPAGPPEIEARAVRTAVEYVAAAEAMYAGFAVAMDERHDEARLADEFAQRQDVGIDVVYGAWLDGGIAGHARAMFSPRGVYMTGGSTVPSARGRGVYRALVRARWDDAVARGTPALAVSAGAMSSPILQRRGFEKVCGFRRLQDVLRVS